MPAQPSPSVVSRLRSKAQSGTLVSSVVRVLKSRTRITAYNLGYRITGGLDGHPLPPPHLVDMVIGTRELAWYQLGGLFMHQAISTFLQRNGSAVESSSTILDFGCGCGRIARWWAPLRGRCEVWGCDYNPALVAWCQKSLSSIATFRVNNADPPLDFPDGKFGLIYSYSVFTHLSADRQRPWMAELVRVLRPGGMLLVTVHGKRVGWRLGFSAEQFREMEDKGLLIFSSDLSGTNSCSAFHSEAYMRSCESLGLDLVDFMPGGVRDTSEQDMYLYRKRER